MEKKLTKHGKSIALILDRKILKELKMNESTIVKISIQDDSLIIKPTTKKKKSSKKKTDDQVADQLLTKYKKTFKKLAKT